MTYQELNNKLKEEQLDNLYVFYGEEKYLIESYTRKIKNIYEKKYGNLENGINYIQIENLENLQSEIEMPCFGFEKKLIVLNKLNISKYEKKEKILDILSKIEEIDPIILIIEKDLDKRLSFTKQLSKISNLVEFKKLESDELIKFFARYFKQNNAQILNGVIHFFVEYAGEKYINSEKDKEKDNLNGLINEADKLIAYSNGKTIDENTILEICPKNIKHEVFEITNLMQDRANNKKILNIYNEMVDSKKTALQVILITLYNHFKKMYKTKLALEQNENIAQILELKPNQTFLVSKYQNVAKDFSLKYWKKAIDYLQDLDYNYKKRKYRFKGWIRYFCL